MKKSKKRKYWIAAIVWLATMILANSINEYFHASPLIRGITVGLKRKKNERNGKEKPGRRSVADGRHPGWCRIGHVV